MGCDQGEPSATPEPAASPVPSEPEVAEVTGDASRGRTLLARYECHRCHEGTGLDEAPIARRCVGCHRAIHDESFDAPAALLAEWNANLHSLPEAPDLRRARHLDPGWLVAFLQDPRDLRPHLEASMPRLAIDETDARDLVAALVAGRDAPEPRSAGGDPSRGRALVEARPCGACHTLSGRVLPARGAPAMEPDTFARARRLAPDLAFARARVREAELVAWLRAPHGVFADTLMPDPALDEAGARDVAAWLLTIEAEPPRPVIPPRLPVLDRQVSYEELDVSLLRRVCWHCHSDPTYALGDGGPGNQGGFGFEGRGLDLATHQGLRSGSRDEAGQRRSVFREVTIEGTTERAPLIVAVLLARQREEAGRPVPGLRGMPLGFPSASPEEIQLLETWIAQGRPGPG